MNVIESFNSLKTSEVHEFELGPEPRFKSDHQILSNVKVENTSQTSTLKRIARTETFTRCNLDNVFKGS